MMKNCIIIEDQPPAQRLLQKYIKDVGSLDLKGTFSNAIDAISFLQMNTVDLIFLDIHLPKISGIDFLKTLKNQPQIILTTAFSDYALESYEYNVVDYLLKPFSFQRFVQAITKSVSLPQNSQKTEEILNEPLTNSSFFIKSGYDLIKVNSNTILYIKSDSDYTEIVTENKTHLSSDSLKKWIERLDNQFYQIHKSYIINTEYMEKISGNQVFLKDQTVIPIGRSFKSQFVTEFLK